MKLAATCKTWCILQNCDLLIFWMYFALLNNTMSILSWRSVFDQVHVCKVRYVHNNFSIISILWIVSKDRHLAPLWLRRDVIWQCHWYNWFLCERCKKVYEYVNETIDHLILNLMRFGPFDFAQFGIKLVKTLLVAVTVISTPGLPYCMSFHLTLNYWDLNCFAVFNYISKSNSFFLKTMLLDKVFMNSARTCSLHHGVSVLARVEMK